MNRRRRRNTLGHLHPVAGRSGSIHPPHAVKGTLVRVEGEPTIRTYDKNGQTGINLDLKFARASVIPRGTAQGGAGRPNPAYAGDWATAPTGGAQNASQADAWSTPGSFDDSPF